MITANTLLLYSTIVIAGGVFLTILTYILARTAALAWYLTKLEHFKNVLRQTNGGDS